MRVKVKSRGLNRVVALRLSTAVFRDVREQARCDDRPVGAYLRRLIAAAMQTERSLEGARDGR